MKNTQHLLFLGAIALFVIVLATGVWRQEDLRKNGQQVILATVPIDPRDLLRGDYVALAYEIGRSEKAQNFIKSLEEGSYDIYTTLTLDVAGRVTGYSFSRDEPSSDTLFIRGKAIVEEYDIFVWDKHPNGETIPTETKKEKQGHIAYPQIEQYFVPEGKGWAIDRMGRVNSGKKLEVKIALGKNGKAQILELLIDGKSIDFSTIEAENPWTDEPVKPVPPVAE